MRGVELVISLLLVTGLSNGLPQYGPGTGVVGPVIDATSCTPYTHDCVPYYQCIDGVINTSGAGLIDVRIRPQTECTNPEYPDVPGICCRIPGATPPPTPAPLQTCSGGLVCVEQGQCTGDGTVNTDGSGLIDQRIYSRCYVDTISHLVGVCCLPPPPPPLTVCPGHQVCLDAGQCSGGSGGGAYGGGGGSFDSCFIDQANYVTGVCCEPPIPVIDVCPDNSVCLPEILCQGDILNSLNTYVPYGSGGTWSQCGLSGEIQSPGVCCRNPVTVPPPPPPAATTCGVRNYGFDVRTQTKLQKNEAQFGEFPWQAVLFFSNFTFKCGASLVEDRWLLTGAHCVAGYQPGDFKVRLGEWQVDKYDEPLNYIDVDIAALYVHPNFDASNLHNDIAVIELAAPVVPQYHINTICIPRPGQLPAVGTRCFATGWGKDAFDGAYQARLKKVDVPFVEHSYCQDLLRRTRLGKYFQLDQSFMCAGGEENIDACTGDGGGPLVCEDPASGAYFLQGITAWGINCGQLDVPGVYVDVQFFRNFIDEIIYGVVPVPINEGGSNPYGRK